jgi:hypothetical protein
MHYTTNRTLLEKADLALADLTGGGGVLLPAQAQTFMRLLIKQSALMQQATVVPMPAPKFQISKIRFGSRVLRPGREGVALAPTDRTRPDMSFLELDAQLFKAEVHLSDEVLEDNIERGELRQTVLEMIAEAAGRDMEEIVIAGDRSSSDPFLSTLDGVLKQSTSHVVDAAGAPLTKAVLRDLLRALPSEYLRDKKQMAFLTSVDADLTYRDSLAERATVGGDKFLEEDTPVLYSGVPVMPVPLFPDNLGAQQNATVALLCNPKNIHVGIWRQIRIETFRDVSAGVMRIVATMRFDVKFADELGTAKAINLRA